MKSKSFVTVVHVVGASSCRRICLEDLAHKSGGRVVDFDYHLFTQSVEKPEKVMLRWLKEIIPGEKLLLCTGLPPKIMMKWLKACMPSVHFREFIWEVHHNAQNEKIILKERSLRMIFDGLFLDAERLIKYKSSELISYTPLKQAMNHLREEVHDTNKCLARLLQWQLLSNQVSYKKALKCTEALDGKKRDASVLRLLKVISNPIMV